MGYLLNSLGVLLTASALAGVAGYGIAFDATGNLLTIAALTAAAGVAHLITSVIEAFQPKTLEANLAKVFNRIGVALALLTSLTALAAIVVAAVNSLESKEYLLGWVMGLLSMVWFFKHTPRIKKHLALPIPKEKAPLF